MRALRRLESGLALVDVALRAPADGEVRVRVRSAGICGSDLHLVHGTIPTVPGTIIGHEGVGVVEEVGADVRRFRPGQRVIASGVIGCGDCDACRRGYPVGCMNLVHKVYGISAELAGAQAELLAVPAADVNLWPAPDDLDDEQILFLTDILPTGFYAAENARIAPGATVVLIGVEQGILLAIVLSLIVHTRHGYRPTNAVLVPAASGAWHALPVARAEQALPGLLIYRFTHSMYYANSQQLFDEVTSLVKTAQPAPPRRCCPAG